MKQLHSFVFGGLLACLLSWNNVAQAQQQVQREGLSEAGTASQRLVEDFGLSKSSYWLPGPSLTNAQNLAELVQLGNLNTATVSQNNPSSKANEVYIMQVGSSNEAYLIQQGSGNATIINQNGDDNTTVINQQGDGNHATSSVNGTNNTTELNQMGNDNGFIRDVITNNVDFKLTQDGNNNLLRQTGTESLAPPKYEVEMRGNGIQLSIQNSRIGQ